MTSGKTYEWLAGWLAGTMDEEYASWKKGSRAAQSLKKYGLTDSKKWPSRENVLNTLVREALCYNKDRYFLSGDDGQSLFAFNGRFFEAVTGKAENFVEELVRRAMRLLQVGTIYQSETCERIAKGCVRTITSSDEYLYVPNRRYIAFLNGVFDLRDGRLREKFDIDYRPYIHLDMDYVDAKECYRICSDKYGMSGNPCRLWDLKMGNDPEESIIPNSQIRDAFQQFCGSLLVDRDEIKIEYVCYLVGPGSNGKSVLASVISKVFGEEYFSTFTPKQLFKDSDARVNIAALQGKIANLVGDLDEKDMSGGDFKRFASGEKFQGRRNYKDPIKVAAPPLLCCTNRMPETKDDSHGHHRRQLPLRTNQKIWTEETKDPCLTQKLTTTEARQYIFNWIYDGYRKIIRNGGNIKLGDEVVKAMRELEDDSNSMRRWWRDYGYVVVDNPEPGDARWRQIKSLYSEYSRYAEEEGYPTVRKRSDLGEMLRSKGFSREKGNMRRMGGGYEYCVGRKDPAD